MIDREDGLCPVCTKQTDLKPNLPFHSIHFRTMWETKSEALQFIACASFGNSHASACGPQFSPLPNGYNGIFLPSNTNVFHMPCANPTQVENTKVSQTWSPLSSSAGEEGRREHSSKNPGPKEQHKQQPSSLWEHEHWRPTLAGRAQREGSRVSSKSWPGPGRARRPWAETGRCGHWDVGWGALGGWVGQ